jgi:outer membrane protein assembly factor BamB
MLHRFLCCWVGVAALLGAAANWPQFRGPGGLGVSEEQGLPAEWSSSQNIVWKTPLPGPGGSSPIVWGDRVYVTCYSGYGVSMEQPGEMSNLVRHLLAIDRRSGEVLWDRTVPAALPEQPFGGFQALHGYASSTPATDGERIYVFFGRTGVLAFDTQGQELWRTEVGTRTHNWGSATSPVLHGDLVIVNASVESGSLVALQRQDGRVVWRAGEIRAAWNTPLLLEGGAGPELVVSVQGRLLGFDPAAGQQLWQAAGIQDYVCPSVVAFDGAVFAIGGRNKPGLAVKSGGRGEVSALWTIDKGSNVSSPVYYKGHLYWAHEGQGIVYCVDAASGTLVYEQRLNPGPGRIYASAVAADDKIYYVSRENGTYVVAAGPSYRLLAHNRLEDDPSTCNGSPAICEGQLLLRSNQYLYCIGTR